MPNTALLSEFVRDVANVVDGARVGPLVLTDDYGRLLSVALVVKSVEVAVRTGKILQAAGVSPSWEVPCWSDRQRFVDNCASYVSLMSDGCTPFVVEWSNRSREFLVLIPLMPAAELAML